jgi:hypothetical protein
MFTVSEATTIRAACIAAITDLSGDLVQEVQINNKRYKRYDIPQIMELIKLCDESLSADTAAGKTIMKAAFTR